jgi:transposase-like protein
MGSKFRPETRERAVRLFLEHRAEFNSDSQAADAIGRELGMAARSVLNWVRAAGRHAEEVAVDLESEVGRLRARNKQLEQDVAILRAATGFFARACDPHGC